MSVVSVSCLIPDNLELIKILRVNITPSRIEIRLACQNFHPYQTAVITVLSRLYVIARNSAVISPPPIRCQAGWFTKEVSRASHVNTLGCEMTRAIYLTRALCATGHYYRIPFATTSIFIRTFTQICIGLTRKPHPSPCPVLLVILTRHQY